jgi:hypothetical protein
LVDFLRIEAISKILGKSNGRLDIFQLGRLVATRKQDNQFSTSFGIVNTVARTDVDAACDWKIGLTLKFGLINGKA